MVTVRPGNSSVALCLVTCLGFFALPAAETGGTRRALEVSLTRANFIDEVLFGAMEANKVAPAPLATDAEFLRRLTLDLTGRIPQPETLEAFLASAAPSRRQTTIDTLLRSPAFFDQFAYYLADRFQVTTAPSNESNISYGLRNSFFKYLRDVVAKDRSYRDMAEEMLTVTGSTEANPAAAFILRQFDRNAPVQDTWDTLTDRVTTQFLGYRSECVSCHNGRRHLEKINLGLVGRQRTEFFEMSAFWSRMQISWKRSDSLNRFNNYFISDRPEGFYDGSVDPANPGSRPTRVGGPWSPKYFTNGVQPSSGYFRQEFAHMVTGDRQFARAAVNYIWAYFFRYGIVDPPNGWDLARVDALAPPPGTWTLQISQPELMERLTGYFIENNYRLTPLIRLIVSSTTYQLSKHPDWKPEYQPYFAKFFPRRLTAEQLYDSFITATATERPLEVRGLDDPVFYANQLRDAAEPESDSFVREMLALFGRGDWRTITSTTNASLLQQLYFLNRDQMVLATHANDPNSTTNRVIRIFADAQRDQDAIRRMFLATLSRPPTDAEVATVMGLRASRPRPDWLSDLQWSLLNKSDFWFNY